MTDTIHRVLKIRQVGEPVLRCKAHGLGRDEITRPDTHDLIESMLETMRDAPGVGLAAPQVGVGLQIAVIEDRAEYQLELTSDQLAERGREPIPFRVLINPILAIVDPTLCLFFEGCLSLNGFTAVTPRAAAVRVTAFNEKGEAIEINAGGWYARILQHEIDHLNGCLYIDRMLPATFMTSVNFQRHWSGQPIPSVCSALGVHGT